MTGLPFRDRREAGEALAARVAALDLPDPLVLALPRGGVPVAAPVAVALGVPLDVLVVRKLGAPGQPELGLGAVASGGVRVVDPDLVARLRVTPEQLERTAQAELAELARRERSYRGDRPAPDVAGRTVVLVDDGLATGSTMRAAVQAVRAGGPRQVVVAVPVGAADSCRAMEEVADEVVCVHAPRWFRAVGEHYLDFRQTTDDEVRALLDEAEQAGREQVGPEQVGAEQVGPEQAGREQVGPEQAQR